MRKFSRHPVLLVCVLLSVLMGAAVGPCPAAAQATNEAPATDTEAEIPVDPIRPLDTERIDKAGERMGAGIERITGVMARYLGGWVDQQAFAGITWLKLTFCLLLLLVVLTVERILRWLIQRRIDGIPTVDGVISWARIFLKALQRPLSLFIWVYGIYGALSPLYGHFSGGEGANLVHEVARRVADIGGSVALFWFLYQMVTLVDARLMRWAQATESTIDDMLVPLLGKTLRVFIVVVGAMVVIQNLTGVKLGPLLASLGIGGLAVALAAKDSIANLFGTLTILFDKPFQVGDRIVLDNYDGTVENVGFRSTRIRLLNGHLVSIPNEKVVNSGIENIGRRPHIRWVTQIGLTYDTPADKVTEAVAIVEEILADHEGMHPDYPPRVFFNGFTDWSLNISVLAWYHPPEYWQYQAWLQRTCADILQRFRDAEIEFAFPSRTLYLANDDRRQLKIKAL
ncbi:MAG: mechanosensitive ion channel family protein [Desulfosarcinaceae bacterium]|nr:mechanosensitive ion channel family protein [Desulfosarcinaceae bacterium]